MDTKYTNDGKKVIVVGKLNNQETIVQEVFVVNGNEIPSGENFVVKSLHDAPAVSWKEKEIERLEIAYVNAQKKTEQEISRMRDIQERAKQVYAGCAAIIKNTNPEMFESVRKMIGGDYKFVLICSKYSKVEILPIDNYLVTKDGYDFSLRLMSIYGKSDGDFSWNINSYRDGSGGRSSFIPCETKEEAIQKAFEFLETFEYTKHSLDFLRENNLLVDKEKLNTYINAQEKNINNSIDRSQKDIEKLNASLKELKAEWSKT